MRLALVTQSYPPDTAGGGIGTQTALKARGLASLGHEVHVLAHSSDGQAHEDREGSVTVHRLPGPDGLLAVHTEPVRWLAYSVKVAGALEQLHLRQPLDVVDFPEWGAEGYTYLLNRTDWNGVPAVVHLHGPLVMFAETMGWPELSSEFYRTGTHMEGTCIRLADAVFSSSRCSTEWCARYYHLDADRVPVLHTGVDTHCFRPGLAPPADRPTILFTGKIVANKGVRTLVEAALLAANEVPDIQLRMVGPGEEALCRELRERVDAAGRPDLVELVGFVPQPELPRELSRAHVFAAPSVYEGGPGFVYLEAMACGLPVVGCSGSGASEVIHPGETGFLVPPGDERALAEVLIRLLRDGELRRRVGEQGRRWVEDHADSESCLRRLEAFYLEAAGCGRREAC